MWKIVLTLFFAKISQKQKNFFGKIALNFYQKISKTKGNSFEQKIPPPGIRTPDLSNNTAKSFEQPPGIRTPDLSKKQRFCLTFTANLSKKIHAENLKIFLKKTFS